ncbi:hypothetical protein FA13DRAFT_602788 [Coprinellus micaceus]|uniref:C3H1-type domain-containing protein n=1 Tax=Coprinellus micaceus TaxID=71717 RepID=A0A4Y7T8N6_COPMI|nr:hypothetical protein FA13DRAFT_602788 [Coprinellus micaceus]
MAPTMCVHARGEGQAFQVEVVLVWRQEVTSLDCPPVTDFKSINTIRFVCVHSSSRSPALTLPVSALWNAMNCPHLLSSGTCPDGSSCTFSHDLLSCEPCGYVAPNPNEYRQHMGSKRHRSRTKDGNGQETLVKYRSVVDEPEKDKNGVTVEGATDLGVLDPASIPQAWEGDARMLVAKCPNPAGTVKLVKVELSSNQGANRVQSGFVIVSAHLGRITPSTPAFVQFKFTQRSTGRYEDQIELGFEDTSLHVRFVITRRLQVIVGNQADHKSLKPTSPCVDPPLQHAMGIRSSLIPPSTASLSDCGPMNCPHIISSGTCPDGPACPHNHTILSCEPCGYLAPTPYDYRQHLGSKRHQSRTKHGDFLGHDYFCTICDANVPSANWAEHIAGGRHRSLAKERGVGPAVAPTDARSTASVEYCPVCQDLVQKQVWGKASSLGEPQAQGSVH